MSNCNEMDSYFMHKAYMLAEKSIAYNEVPIGAVVVYNGKVVGEGYNRKEAFGNPLYHAEIIAIQEALNYMKDWRLNDVILYATAEPCIMCCGAILQFRVGEVVFGVSEPKFGGIISQAKIFDITSLNHNVKYRYGIRDKEIRKMMKDFFKDLRDKKK